MRIVFMGSPAFAVPFLDKLIKHKYDIKGVYTAPLKARGRRGNKLEPSAIGKFASEQQLTVFTPKSLKSKEVQDELRALQADVIIVVAYGMLLPQAVLDIPKYGCINVHGSILPRFRGAAPIERAIIAGDKRTGICIMQMEKGLDTGPVALEANVAIGKLNSGELREVLAKLGSDLLIEALEKLQQGKLNFKPQSGEPTYAEKITKEELRINWQEDAELIERKIRAFAPSPAAWCEMNFGKANIRVKILQAEISDTTKNALSKQCGNGKFLHITKCQKAGGKILDAKQFLAGQNTAFEIL